MGERKTIYQVRKCSQIITHLAHVLCSHPQTFKFVNKFKGNTENASVVNMPFQVLRNKQYKISPYLLTARLQLIINYILYMSR